MEIPQLNLNSTDIDRSIIKAGDLNNNVNFNSVNSSTNSNKVLIYIGVGFGLYYIYKKLR
jgi:hypothetical protein